MGCMQNRIGECGAVHHWRLSEPTFTPAALIPTEGLCRQSPRPGMLVRHPAYVSRPGMLVRHPAYVSGPGMLVRHPVYVSRPGMLVRHPAYVSRLGMLVRHPA